jgi:hypothetical protein
VDVRYGALRDRFLPLFSSPKQTHLDDAFRGGSDFRE